MGSITVIIILFILAIVGNKGFLIALAVGAVLGLISGIVQAVEQRRKNNYKQYYENQSHFKNKDQVDNNMIVMEMMEEEQEIDGFNLETDCECDWQDIRNEDVSQSDWNDDDQIVNDMIVMEMMEEEQERDDFKTDSFNWETDCESCEELLEDCECDWQDISREDISQSDWNDDDSDNDGTSFDNFGG